MSVMPDDIASQLGGAGGPLGGQQPAPLGGGGVNPDAGAPDPTTASPTPPQSPAAGIPGMQQDISGLQDKQSGIVEAELGATQQVEQELQGMKQPQRQMNKVMDAAPLLIGLMAIGGKAAKLHGSVMLGALNGAVGGMLKGNQQAFEDNQKKYLDAKQKVMETWELQQHYYDTVYKAYGDQIKNREQAIQVARDLTNDQWNKDFKQQQLATTQAMDQTKAWYMQQSINERIKALDDKTMFQQLQAQVNMMNATTRAKDVDSKVQQRQAIIQKSLTDPNSTPKMIDGMVKDVSTQMSALKKKYSDIETMTPEDRQKYDALLNEMGQLEVGRKLLTPVPVQDPSDVDALDVGQRYQRPDGSIHVKGGAQAGGSDGASPQGGAAPAPGQGAAPGAGGPSAGGQPPQSGQPPTTGLAGMVPQPMS